ncbi:bifunctional nicotinamidase/pyrazinamidase [Methylobacterium sp. J-068]|uniref:bifunctional nicotinamidase/pyrazinamidase n=1 Tax=Methylobacterium sp. J-068 TaxID=2836649 RepID=UPI001FB94A47|nr:bifunctional nicotinamidase/pyrazinamidase [Methylobacterium sp. J-068]MCJ2035728.1 bifunctional nicotinamidase/pyrazinamidase [Methylobacterium sp. J-068]
MIPGSRDVLLVIDVQVDFLPGGALAVPEGDAVIAPVNRLLGLFPHAVLTQDWHPPEHVSFAASHPGGIAFDTVCLAYGSQVLWPEHCVQGSAGAELAPGLASERAELVLRKGHHPAVDSYSAFLEADRRTPTGLAGYLRERGFTRVVLCGLATDYCVAWSALDARAAGFEVLVVEDAVRGIDHAGSVARAWAEMAAAGIGRIAAGAIAGYTALP